MKTPDLDSDIRITMPAEILPGQYLKISKTSRRRADLVALGEQYHCSWAKVAYYAIDLFLIQNPPPKKP